MLLRHVFILAKLEEVQEPNLPGGSHAMSDENDHSKWVGGAKSDPELQLRGRPGALLVHSVL